MNDFDRISKMTNEELRQNLITCIEMKNFYKYYDDDDIKAEWSKKAELYRTVVVNRFLSKSIN